MQLIQEPDFKFDVMYTHVTCIHVYKVLRFIEPTILNIDLNCKILYIVGCVESQ